MSIFIKQNSIWKRLNKAYRRITINFSTSIWQAISVIYVKYNNIWKLVYPDNPTYFFCKRSTNQDDTYGNKGGSGIASFQNDTFIVPQGVTTITAELWGGGGSGGAAVYGGGSPGEEAIGGNGGGGGYVKATLSVTPGEILTIRVGGGAWHYAANVTRHPSLTISGTTSSNILVVSRRSDESLNNQSTVGGIGGSGGGYSAIFRGLTPLLIAGGGGGGGGTNAYSSAGQSYGGNGGAGGGSTGQSGTNGFSTLAATSNTGYGGGGGTQTSGGSGGAGTTNSLCYSTNAESGGYLVGGRGKNSPEYQGNLSGSVLLVDNGTASNPGTNGGAAGGGSGRTNTTVCNGGAVGGIQVTTSSLYIASNCGGGGGGGYYGGGGGGVGRGNLVITDTSHGGGGGGGGSNYVGGAASVLANSQGSGRTPGNTSSQYYITTYLYSPQSGISQVPYNAFDQGGVGYGGQGGITPVGNFTTINYGTRGENGLIVIYW